MRILVIASAPVYMRPSPKSPAYLSALRKAGLSIPTSDIENESAYQSAAKGFAKRTRDLFQGSFQKVVKGVDALRSQGMKVDLFAISPRYGIVSDLDLLLPYSFSLTRKPKSTVRKISERLRTREVVSDLLKAGYDQFILMANRADLLFVHDPEHGFDLGAVPVQTIVIGAPSLSGVIGGHRFLEAKQPGARSEIFARYVDEMTATDLRDYTV